MIGELGTILGCSHLYLTQSWGTVDQRDHYNQVVSLATDLAPEALMWRLIGIEQQMGRLRTTQYGPRIIDIDMLFYGQHMQQTELLILPHPRLHERNFALVPLMDLAPDFVHPQLSKTIEELYLGCLDTLEVLMIENDG